MNDSGAYALGAFSNLAGNAISAITSSSISKSNREWNEKMWNLQNEYNTPAAQMQRLKAAGLNPNLAYGNLASSNAGQVGSADVYGNKEITQALSKLNLVEAGVSIAKAIQEMRKTKAEAESTEIDNNLSLQNLRLRESEMEAIERYSMEHSAYGIKQAASGKHLVRTGQGFSWQDSIPNDDLNSIYSQYFYDKLLFNLQNIVAGKNLKEAQKGATDAIKSLRLLDIPFYNVRNRWQPWNYGIDASTKALNSIMGGYGIYMKSLPKPAPVYNYNTYNKYQQSYFH